MKGYAEIKEVMVRKLGLYNLEAYKRYSDAFMNADNPRIPTKEEIELLSPDAIDNNAFWRVAEELFSTDPVSNCEFNTPPSKEEANRRNLNIYHVDGFTGLCLALKAQGKPKRVLEIGPGYGAFKQWFEGEMPSGWTYYGADVYPRVERVEATLLNGRLAETTLSRQYYIVIASNVFQHLSVAQRRDYYRNIAHVLAPGGYFMVSMMVDSVKPDAKWRDSEGRVWCRHYGQFTEIQSHHDICRDLRVDFAVEGSTIRNRNSWGVFRCEKRSEEPANPAV